MHNQGDKPSTPTSAKYGSGVQDANEKRKKLSEEEKESNSFMKGLALKGQKEQTKKEDISEKVEKKEERIENKNKDEENYQDIDWIKSDVAVYNFHDLKSIIISYGGKIAFRFDATIKEDGTALCQIRYPVFGEESSQSLILNHEMASNFADVLGELLKQKKQFKGFNLSREKLWDTLVLCNYFPLLTTSIFKRVFDVFIKSAGGKGNLKVQQKQELPKDKMIREKLADTCNVLRVAIEEMQRKRNIKTFFTHFINHIPLEQIFYFKIVCPNKNTSNFDPHQDISSHLTNSFNIKVTNAKELSTLAYPKGIEYTQVDFNDDQALTLDWVKVKNQNAHFSVLCFSHNDNICVLAIEIRQNKPTVFCMSEIAKKQVLYSVTKMLAEEFMVHIRHQNLDNTRSQYIKTVDDASKELI